VNDNQDKLDLSLEGLATVQTALRLHADTFNEVLQTIEAKLAHGKSVRDGVNNEPKRNVVIADVISTIQAVRDKLSASSAEVTAALHRWAKSVQG
jgi:hypothetical protein